MPDLIPGPIAAVMLVPAGLPADIAGQPVVMAVRSSTTTATLAAAPPLAGSGGTAAPATGARPAPSGGGFSDPTFMYLVLLAIGGMLVFSIFTQRKERKRREALLGGLKKHDRVQTIGGVIGSVVEVKPDVVILKVDESSNTRMTFARSAVQQILRGGPESSSDSPAKS